MTLILENKREKEEGVFAMSAVEISPSLTAELKKRFEFFRVENLSGIDAQRFKQSLISRIGKVDSESEGYQSYELGQQRDLSIKFHWGHNHDFGGFFLKGRMGDRHLELMSDFIEKFPVELATFFEADVFDIGCWTGGTSLLLKSLGSRVVAIEEVRKYADTVNFLASSFGVSEHLSCVSKSLFECNRSEYHDRFDVAYFPGVIYHLSDPVLALRILFNSLKLGGEILVESAGVDSPEPICRFDGNYVYRNGTREELNRGGWNWFLPSASALERMLVEAGFESVQTCWCEDRCRVFGYGKKCRNIGICKAGLSVPDII